jgi:hypothetical protein
MTRAHWIYYSFPGTLEVTVSQDREDGLPQESLGLQIPLERHLLSFSLQVISRPMEHAKERRQGSLNTEQVKSSPWSVPGRATSGNERMSYHNRLKKQIEDRAFVAPARYSDDVTKCLRADLVPK